MDYGRVRRRHSMGQRGDDYPEYGVGPAAVLSCSSDSDHLIGAPELSLVASVFRQVFKGSANHAVSDLARIPLTGKYPGQSSSLGLPRESSHRP